MSKNTETITLFKSRGSWIARFSDPEVVRLFGTPDVPTPFTDEADAGTVAETVKGRNPGVTIIVKP